MRQTRYGLAIGINDYPGTGSDLTGCVNDAMAWTGLLDERGYKVQTLLNSDATAAAIRGHIQQMMEMARFGDICVVTFSGHGSWIPDVSGDEPDRRDEGLVPYDVRTAGLLIDDELHDLFSERKHGVRVVLVADSCHSGTVTRLAGPVVRDAARVRYLPPEAHLRAEELPAARAVAGVPPQGRSRPTALLMAGCKDGEYSYDGYAGIQMGAFTHVAVTTLSRLPEGATYRQWQAAIRQELPRVDVPQTPQLFGTRAQLGWPIFEPIERAARRQ